ncbi:MAG: ABC-F family ATP-binding cassette domain-containing protein [Muribaculaceae bacterium]|nr:ABC-F family ATP-binding cassette domain-containing protein [Muribaculaceae bacterium]
MASFLQVEKLTKSYGDRMLFEDVTFGIEEGDKIGVVAKNGTGKSTLLGILDGSVDYDSGRVVWRDGLRVGYLPQKPEFEGNPTVAEAALMSDDPRALAVRAYEDAMASGDTAAMEKATRTMDEMSAWSYEDRLRQTLFQLGLTDLAARVENLSGGQRKRVALASIIMRDPDLLILDEPTNHLDIGVIEWLENYLKRSRMTLLMVTHDRYFLDRVCNKIIEIDNRTIYTYQGNFDYYLRRRAERIEAMTAELAKVRNTLRREQEWMSRQPQARAGKAKFRIDSFYELKDREASGIRPERQVDLDVKASYIGSKIFEAKNVSKRFGDKIILNDFSYTFARYEKVGIIGANGVGKSTFIKMLQGLVPADSGSWDIGTTVRFGYYSQDGISFDSEKKVIDAVTEIAEEVDTGDYRLSPMQFLTRFLFSPADQQKYIHTLSGGELCRLHLATVLMRQPNFLILDEPTNDLDIVTLGILEEYLSEFKGCVIVISHDRYFLDNIVDHLLVMEGDGEVKDFPGTYTEYAGWRAAREADARRDEAPAEPRREKPRAERPQKMSFKERKEFEALTAEIDSLSAEKAELEARFNSGEALEDAAALSARYQELSDLLDEKELRWLELSEKE